MGPLVSETQGAVFNDVWFQTRVVAPTGSATGQAVAGEGTAVQASDVSTVGGTVIDLTNGGMPVPPGNFGVTTANFTNLIADNDWRGRDLIGRNFKCRVPGSYFPMTNHIYQVTFNVILTDGTVINWYHNHLAK